MEAPTPADVNIAAIFIATLLVLILAFAWYRPRLSMYAKGEAARAIALSIVFVFFAILTQAIVEVTHSPHYWDPVNGRHLTWVDGARGAGFIWGAWAMPPLLCMSTWGERSWRAFARDAAFLLLALLVSGIMTSVWTRSG